MPPRVETRGYGRQDALIGLVPRYEPLVTLLAWPTAATPSVIAGHQPAACWRYRNQGYATGSPAGSP